MADDFLILSRAAFRRQHGLEVDAEVPVEPTAVAEWFAAARRNRVAGLFADFPSLSGTDSEWYRQACGQALHSARLTREAERIYSALKPALPSLRLIKGPVLSAQAWPRPGLRSFDDIDFRCAKKDLPSLCAGLDALGYQAETSVRFRLENLWHFGWGISFRNADGVLAEFNHLMFPPHYPWPSRLTTQAGEGWSSQMLDQIAVDCPSPSLHLLLSCVHAVWHGWERLGWLADIAGLLVQHADCFAEAERLTQDNSFIRRSLHCACRVADRVFGPLPGADAFDADDPELVEQALEIVTRKTPNVPQKTQREIHHRLMSSRERAVYTARRLATPGDPDFTSWPLSAQLNSLYWAIRPVRYLHGRIVRD